MYSIPLTLHVLLKFHMLDYVTSVTRVASKQSIFNAS